MALILNVCSSRQNPLMEIKRRELYTHRYTPCVSKCTYQPFTAHPSFSKELNLKVLVSTFVQWGLSHFVYLIGCLSMSIIYKKYESGCVTLLALKLPLYLFMAFHRSLNKNHILTMTSGLFMIWPCYPCQSPPLSITSF